jgi:hypothetical protein
MASGVKTSGSEVGQLADDRMWSRTSHGGPTRPADRSVLQLIAAYGID